GETVRTYTVTVTREPSSNAELSGLQISGGGLTGQLELEPAFAAEHLDYTLTVSNAVHEVTVTPTVADTTARVTVNGEAVASGGSTTVELAVGSNPIEIVVTAEDGETVRTYTV